MTDTIEDQLQFLEYSKPSLVEAGTYRVVVTQDLSPYANDPKTFPKQEFDFAVFGERFSLNQDAIHTVFPPAGSMGRRTDVLPHICIKSEQARFPWERSAYAGGEDYEPWVALLLFEEKEFAKEEVVKQVVKAGSLRTELELPDGTKVSLSPHFPTIELEKPGQSADDLVTVIDVKRTLLEKILPTWEDLKLLAHIRRRQASDGSLRNLAVVMSNRLPRAGSDSVMHLVSLEERYDDTTKAFKYQSAGPDDYIRLVSLTNWSFSSAPETGKDFEELVEDLDTGTLALPVPAGNTDAEKYLARGFVPMPHKLRQCSTTYSWYHGPVVPYAKNTKFSLDAHLPELADNLVEVDKTLGMFDASYAAAFELGRVLALEDKSFSAALYQWKLRENEKLKQAEQASFNTVVARPAPMSSDGADPLATRLQKWLDELALLQHVPFNYLVPDERMLPAESIRFFQLDWHWIECLVYGAFTVGGYSRELKSDATDLWNKFKSLATRLYGTDKPASGFLLRSKLVADYPDLLVDAYSGSATATTNPDPTSKLVQHRLANLGKDVLLCLCAGAVNTTELYLKPEGLRFGLDEESNEGMVLELPMDATTTAALPDIELLQAVQVIDGGKHADGLAFGDCFQFANQAHVRLRYPTVLKNPSIRSFTIAFWMKASDLTVKANPTRIFDATWDSNNFIQWVVLEANKVQLCMKVNGVAYRQKSNAISTNAWCHIAGVWNAREKKLRVYVDGVCLGENSGTLEVTPGLAKGCDIGQRSDGTCHFSGSLAHFNLFDRTLDDAQVKALMDVTKMSKSRLVLPFDEATYEHLGRGIDRIGGAELIPDTDMAYCLAFNGKDSFVKLKYLPEIFDNLGTSDFTISLWFNARNLPATFPWVRLLDAGKDANHFVQLSIPEANKIQVTVRKSGVRYQKKSRTLTTGTWHHLAVTWAFATNEAKLYINGIEATGSGVGEPVTGANPCFELGRHSDGTGYFDGHMAYLRVYDRVQTVNEIVAIRKVDLICVNTKRYEKSLVGVTNPVPMDALIRDGGKRVVKIKTGLADRIQAEVVAAAIAANKIPRPMNSAEFGMHMIEGSNKGRIVKKP